MTKRIKEVHPDDMVAHLWAHKVQGHARNSKRTFYFNDDTIYSYGSHFPIAKHVRRGNKEAVLFTTRSYSQQTTGHTWSVRQAVPDTLPVVYCQNPEHVEPGKEMECYADELVELVGKYERARNQKQSYLSQMESVVEKANNLARFFGLKRRLSLPKNAEEMQAVCEDLRRKNTAAQSRRRRAEERKRQLEMEKVETARQKWLNGEGDRYPSHRHYIPNDPVRLRVKGEELQTSLGAIVPLEHAKKAFRFIRKCRERHQAWQTNGKVVRLGHFRLDSIDENGNVHAGCHHVAWDEVERVAKIAGVY